LTCASFGVSLKPVTSDWFRKAAATAVATEGSASSGHR
jgi:hypothetical protein